MNDFPRRPLFDQIIVRHTPVASLLTDEDKKFLPLEHDKIQLRNHQGVVVAVSDQVTNVSIGDVVHFEDTAMYVQVYARPADEYRSGLEKFFLMRVQDLRGVEIR